MGKLTPGQFRKRFLDKVQGQPVKIAPPEPAPLAPEYPPEHWAKRLVACGVIDQATLERMSHSDSQHLQQETGLMKPHVEARRKADDF